MGWCSGPKAFSGLTQRHMGRSEGSCQIGVSSLTAKRLFVTEDFCQFEGDKWQGRHWPWPLVPRPRPLDRHERKKKYAEPQLSQTRPHSQPRPHSVSHARKHTGRLLYSYQEVLNLANKLLRGRAPAHSLRNERRREENVFLFGTPRPDDEIGRPPMRGVGGCSRGFATVLLA